MFLHNKFFMGLYCVGKLSSLPGLLRKYGISTLFKPQRIAHIVKLKYNLIFSNDDSTENESVDVDQINDILSEIVSFPIKPTISIVMPVYNIDPKWLKKAIYSVLNQIYSNWQLCICDDASTNHETIEILRQFEQMDERITVVYRNKNGNISAASNSAVKMASGEYISFMDDDDELTPDALYEVVKAINDSPEAGFFYSDEAKLDENGEICDSYYKPDWSPHHLSSCMYVLHMITLKKSLLHEIGGFRSEYDGCQDYDLALRAAKRAKQIVHIPKILYLWRKIEGSSAARIDAKEYAFEKTAELLKEMHPYCTVEHGLYLGTFRVRPNIKPHPKVSLLIFTNDLVKKPGKNRDINILCNFMASIREKTDYDNYEIVIVVDGDLSDFSKEYLKDYSYRLLSYEEKGDHFNLARKFNFGVSQVDSDLVMLLNDDMEVISPGWLEAMVEAIHLENVGAVGAKLLFEDDRIQHAGILFNQDGLPFHPFRLLHKNHIGYNGFTHVIRDYSAVTGACLLFRKNDFERVNGFDETFAIDFNDIDFLLKLRALGKNVVFTPFAELYHFEGMSTSPNRPNPEEVKIFVERWGNKLKHDPFNNINISSSDYADDMSDIKTVKMVKLDHNSTHKEINIGYNGFQISNHDGTGKVSNRTLYYLSKLDKINQYSVYTNNDVSMPAGLEFATAKRVDGFNDVALMEEMFTDSPSIDIFHSPHPFHFRAGCASSSIFALAPISILQILDLIMCKRMVDLDDEYHRSFVAHLQIACEWCDRITTISEFTKNEVIEYFDVSPDKIQVIHLGVDEKFKKINDKIYLDKVKQKYGLGDNYILFLGNHFKHKNLEILAQAFCRLKQQISLKHKLVLCGDVIDKRANADILTYADQEGISDEIKVIGPVEEEDILGLYNLADLFVFPSLYEGFGLPVLEAMACGVPVVASNQSSIPEVAGDAACLVDPTSPAQLAEAIQKVCTDGQYRQRLIDKGFVRAKKFSWENTARETLEMYYALYKRHRNGKLYNRNKNAARTFFINQHRYGI